MKEVQNIIDNDLESMMEKNMQVFIEKDVQKLVERETKKVVEEGVEPEFDTIKEKIQELEDRNRSRL